MDEDRMLKWFAYEHLPPPLRDVSACFHDLALTLCGAVAPGPERTVALRKHCNGRLAVTTSGDPVANLSDCLHADDVAEAFRKPEAK